MNIELNGKNFEIDFFDVEILENYQKALNYLENIDIEKLLASDSTVAFIKGYCDTVYRFFDIFFGEGTASNLFENRRHLKTCNECVYKCIERCSNYLENQYKKDTADIFQNWQNLLNDLSKNDLSK